MKYIFDLDIDLCTACGACSVACMDQNDTNIENGDPPLKRVLSNDEEGEYLTLSCMHCENSPCIAACPRGCLFKDSETGFTNIDNSHCIGCKKCQSVCYYKAPLFDKHNKMHKCNGCSIRIKNDLEPACVRVCPTGALRVYTEEEYKNARIYNSLKKTYEV